MGELWVWCGYPMVGVAVWKDNGRMEGRRRPEGERMKAEGMEDEGRGEGEKGAEVGCRRSGGRVWEKWRSGAGEAEVVYRRGGGLCTEGGFFGKKCK